MRCCEVENHVLGWLLTSKTTLNHSNNKRIVTDTKVVDWPPESPDNQYHLNK